MNWLAVGIGGFAGAVARYAISGAIHRLYPGFFPLGTLTVNFLGCLLIGFLMTVAELNDSLTPPIRLMLVTGFLGSLTTFSTFGFEIFELLRSGRAGLAIAGVLANIVLGLAAVLIGRAVAVELV